MFCRVCASAYLRRGGVGREGDVPVRGRGMCNAACAGAPCLAPRSCRVRSLLCDWPGLPCKSNTAAHGTRDGKSATAAAAAATFSHIVQARSSSSVRPSATCFVRTGCTRSVRSKPVLSGDLSCRNLSRRAGAACCLVRCPAEGETCSPCQRPTSPD